MNVARNISRTDNRVHPRKTNATRAFHTPKGVGAGNEARGQGDDGLVHRGKDVSKFAKRHQEQFSEGVEGCLKEWTTTRGCLDK